MRTGMNLWKGRLQVRSRKEKVDFGVVVVEMEKYNKEIKEKYH